MTCKCANSNKQKQNDGSWIDSADVDILGEVVDPFHFSVFYGLRVGECHDCSGGCSCRSGDLVKKESSTYRYRDVERRRAYMRDYMRRRRGHV